MRDRPRSTGSLAPFLATRNAHPPKDKQVRTLRSEKFARAGSVKHYSTIIDSQAGLAQQHGDKDLFVALSEPLWDATPRKRADVNQPYRRAKGSRFGRNARNRRAPLLMPEHEDSAICAASHRFLPGTWRG